MMPYFSCPSCNEVLSIHAGQFVCNRCGFTLTDRNGVWVDSRVEGEKDKQFYDHIYESTHGEQWYQGLNRTHIFKRILEYVSLSYRRERFFKQQLKGKNNLILDVASGAGRDYFATYGTVVGVDVSFDPLLHAKKRYAIALQSGVERLPFPDNTFDYVVSSDFFGHVRNEDKDTVIKEIQRVLKPGGKTIHVIETDSTNWLFKVAHSDLDLFQKYFIEKIGGHIGLEMPSAVIKRWKKSGFEITVVKKIWGTIWPIQYYRDLFGPEYPQKFSVISRVCWISEVLSRVKIVQVVVNIVLTPINWLVEFFTPLDHGVGLMLVCQKKK